MARPSNESLIARVKELEAQLAARPVESTGAHMPHRVRGLLKDIIRHPERAAALATEALENI